MSEACERERCPLFTRLDLPGFLTDPDTSTCPACSWTCGMGIHCPCLAVGIAQAALQGSMRAMVTAPWAALLVDTDLASSLRCQVISLDNHTPSEVLCSLATLHPTNEIYFNF
ncbi:hypothetical protein AC579_964 [Pseudocercospora musae]|uniref:Uncharacterized protein n=1 Tax=Pseudocercospora musae TaxID=113226 RepID=A0A139IUC4_9PEZI|nr:hypothetical protein AC579_964 [Pseudocercospora musae]